MDARTGANNPSTGTSNPEPEHEWLRAAYEFAWGNRNHADGQLWEMTAIVWGAQTLLLGFVLEAIASAEAHHLIVVTGVLGLVLCYFNYAAVKSRNRVCHAMIDVCKDIESDGPLPEKFRPQHRLDEKYRNQVQSRAFNVVNLCLIVVWLVVIATIAWPHLLNVLRRIC